MVTALGGISIKCGSNKLPLDDTTSSQAPTVETTADPQTTHDVTLADDTSLTQAELEQLARRFRGLVRNHTSGLGPGRTRNVNDKNTINTGRESGRGVNHVEKGVHVTGRTRSTDEVFDYESQREYTDDDLDPTAGM